MAIAVDQNYDKAQRKISTANLEQFAGVDCQLLVEKETHRPIIMDGETIGGAFKCVSKDELDENYLGINDEAQSAKSVEWTGVKNVPEAVANALTYLTQSLTPEQKQQVMTNLSDTWLSLLGGVLLGGLGVKEKTDNEASIYCVNEDGELQISMGGKSYETITKAGSTLTLRSKTPNELEEGDTCFGLNVVGKSGSLTFTGDSTGHLLWGGKELERVHSSGDNYIRYNSGILICWGRVSTDANGAEWTFPVPFKDTGYAVSVLARGGSASVNSTYEPLSNTKMKVRNSEYYGSTVCAIGRWK